MLFYAAASAGLVTLIKPLMDSVLSDRLDARRSGASASISAPGASRSSVIYLFKGLGAYFSTYLMTDVGQRVVRDLRNQLFRHILNQSAGFFSRRTSGQLMSGITNDVQQIQVAVSETVGDLLREGLSVIGFACADVLLRLQARARRRHRRAGRRLSAGAARPARAADQPPRAGRARATCRTSRSRRSPATASSRRSAPRRTRRRGSSAPPSGCIAPI